jgi:hypothetical protein
MPSGRSDKYDFFLSRRGSVATIAQVVTDVLKENAIRFAPRITIFRLRRTLSTKCTRPLRTLETSLCCSRATTSSRLTLEWSSRVSRQRPPKVRKASHGHPALRGRVFARSVRQMKLPHRMQFLHLAAGAAALPAISRVARAQAYPTRVRFVVGFAPGVK